MLIEQAKYQLNLLNNILNQLSTEQYVMPLASFDDSTIGKHTRHVLEFYESVFNTTEDIVCYDDRKRNMLLEENIRFTINNIESLNDMLDSVETNKRILLKIKHNDNEQLIETTLFRELSYNVEHAIHHLAILRIAINIYFPHVQLPAEFGYANATLQFLKEKH